MTPPRPPHPELVSAAPLRRRLDQLRALGWTELALARVMTGRRECGSCYVGDYIRPDRLEKYMVALDDPGPIPRRTTFDFSDQERPTMLPEALDQYDRDMLEERRRERLARLLADNERKRLMNLKRNTEARG